MPFVSSVSIVRTGFPAITQITGSIDCGALPGRAVFAQIASVSSGAAQTATAFSVGGVALVKSNEIIAGSNGKQVWDVVSDAIPTGVQPYVITINGAVTSSFEANIFTRNAVQSIRSRNVPNAAGLGAAAWASTAQATASGDPVVGSLKYEIFPSEPVVAGVSGTSIQYNEPTGFSTNRHVVFEKTATGTSTSVNLTSSPNFFPYFDAVWAIEPAQAGDTTPPTMNGALSVSGYGFRLAWLAGSDNVGVTGYEVSLNGGSTYTDVGNVLFYDAANLAVGTYQVRVRCYDAAGNRSPVYSGSVQISSSGVVATGVQINVVLL